MYLYFVDESKAQPNQDFTVIGGLILEENDVNPILKEFKAIKRKHNIDPSFEISWSSMRRSEKEKMTYDERESLRKEVLKLVAKSNCILISGAVCLEKAKMKGIINDFQIYCYGLMVASERLQYYMQDVSKEKGKKCYSVIVAHRFGSHKDASKINSFCRKISESGTFPFKVNLNNILINLLFSTAEVVPILQLSDFCVGGLRCFLNTNDRKYYDIYDWKFRKSKEDKIEGRGIVFYPSNPGVNVEIQWPF